MAWDSDPEVAAMREYGSKFDRPVVVAFSIKPDGNGFKIVTYGASNKLCKLAASFGDKIAAAIEDGTIAAPEVEPTKQIPICQTWVRESKDSDQCT